MKENILGYAVDVMSSELCTDSVFHMLTESSERGKGCRWLACLNPHSYTVALEDGDFAEALNGADWLIPDGAGVVLASRILGGSIRQRVTGSDVFFGLQERMSVHGGLSVFFLGGTSKTLKEICQKVGRDYPGIRVLGTYSPPFKASYSEGEIDEMVKRVNAVSPDVLWVGMTAPKQEKWLHQNRDRLQVRFAGAVGAVFDFYTGQVKRSSPTFQRLGLEWLPRLIQQPRRLWRRTLVSAPVFLWHVVKQKVRGVQR